MLLLWLLVVVLVTVLVLVLVVVVVVVVVVVCIHGSEFVIAIVRSYGCCHGCAPLLSTLDTVSCGFCLFQRWLVDDVILLDFLVVTHGLAHLVVMSFSFSWVSHTW